VEDYRGTKPALVAFWSVRDNKSGEATMKRFITIFASIALTLCVAKPAAADFLYDLTGLDGHQQFQTSSILTSTTTITTFIVNTSSFQTLVLGPDSGDNCNVPGFFTKAGPCVNIFTLANGGVSGADQVMLQTFESVGTFTGNLGAHLTISEVSAVPEPTILMLLLIAVGALTLIRFRRRQP
jgi:hypothetical protein